MKEGCIDKHNETLDFRSLGIPPWQAHRAENTHKDDPRTATCTPSLLPASQAPPDASTSTIMPGPKNTLLIEGTFEELTDEFAQYVDSLKKSQGDESSSLQTEAADLLKENKKDDVLKKLVVGSQALNQAPEKGMAMFK